MYAKARAERIRAIRAASARLAAQGFLLLGAGVALFVGLAVHLKGTSRFIIGTSSVAVVFGTWRFFKGIFGIVFSPSKEGSLADEE